MSAMDMAVALLQIAGALLIGSGIRALGWYPPPRCPASVLVGSVLLFVTGLGSTVLRGLLTMVPSLVWWGVIGTTVGLAISLPVSLHLVSRRAARAKSSVADTDRSDAAATNGPSSSPERRRTTGAPS